MAHIETQEQKQERIQKHLEGVIDRLQQALTAPIEIGMKRIEADAAAIAVLTMISELLPEQIQEQIRTIVVLHEGTWNITLPLEEEETPHKSLTDELIEHIISEDNSSEDS